MLIILIPLRQAPKIVPSVFTKRFIEQLSHSNTNHKTKMHANIFLHYCQIVRTAKLRLGKKRWREKKKNNNNIGKIQF